MTARTQHSKFIGTVHYLARLNQHNKDLRPIAKMGLNPNLAQLRQWQTERLARTYSDLLSSRRYGPACRFFMSDIYAASDFSQRDRDLEHLYELMSRLLPDFLLSLASKAMELNKLTNNLDQALLHVLVDELDITNGITPELYAEAYRICDNYAERSYQIEKLVEIGRQVELGTRIPLVGMTLRLASGPARSAGWHEVHDFFERGYKAFKHMNGGAKTFLGTIEQREKRILDKIYAGDPDPFKM